MRRFVLAALALTVLAACQPPDTSSEWQAITDAYLAAWNTGDFSGLDAVIAQDFVHRTTAPATSTVGLDSLRTSITATRTTYSGFRVTVEEMVTMGDRATLRYVITGTDSLGTQSTANGISVLRMANGRLVEEMGVWDALAWMGGLGYVLSPPTDSGG
jgi:ketosteroid isomerase-like protein